MEILKYHNDINKLKIGHFTEREIDIFFTLLLKARDSDQDIIIINFSELKALIEGNRSEDRLITNIRNLNIKLKSLVQEIQDINGDYITFSLFGDIITSPSRKLLETSINPRFKHLIDNLMGNFTLLDLKELVSLKGNYPKTLYRLLKQWESAKKFAVSIEEFREVMGIPDTYKMFNIDQKVLTPCLEELKQYFKGLKVKKIKRGIKVASLEFTWREQKERKALEAIEPVRYKYGTPEDMKQYRNGSQKDIYEEIKDRESAADLQEITEVQEAEAVKILIEQGLGNIVNLKEKSPTVYWNSIRRIIKKFLSKS